MTHDEFSAMRDLIQAEIRWQMEMRDNPADRPRIERALREYESNVRIAAEWLIGHDPAQPLASEEQS
jgi:hypothetical protein